MLFENLAAVEGPGITLLQLKFLRMGSILQAAELAVRHAMGHVASLLLVVL